MNRKAIVLTLGCRLNTADSALLVSRLAEAGYEVAESAEKAALAVVNSCTVTAEAARKSRQAVRKLRATHPEAVIVVTGCSAELDRDAFLTDGAADVVLSNPEKRSLPELVLEYLAGRTDPGGAARSSEEPITPFRERAFGSFPFRSRAFLKIQEGCNNFCSYCIVPYARGPERSRAFDEVLADCRRAVADGFPELVLTGVNTCAYSDAGRGLGELVHAVAGIDGDFRIRLSSTEPAPDNRGLLDVMASEPKVCRFLHLALQHGSNRILKLMNRHYTTDEYAAFVEAAREKIPGIHLGSDLIVGFPGETEKAFQALLEFLEEFHLERVGFFAFSPQPGTPAEKLPNQIAEAEKERRLELAQEKQSQVLEQWHDSLVGKVLSVFIDERDREKADLYHYEGRTCWDAPEIDGLVTFSSKELLSPGQLVDVRITHSRDYILSGEIANESSQ